MIAEASASGSVVVVGAGDGAARAGGQQKRARGEQGRGGEGGAAKHGGPFGRASVLSGCLGRATQRGSVGPIVQPRERAKVLMRPLHGTQHKR